MPRSNRLSPKAPPILHSINDMLGRLPRRYQWSCEITDDVCDAVPAVMNVYVNSEEDRISLRLSLGFGRPTEQTDTTEHHRVSNVLLVALIEV